MIDEQIRDGDYVVVEPRGRPRNGETVVALLDEGEATLKKYYRDKNRIRLQPANPDYAPIYTEPGRLHIQGVVIGVLRTY
jgi:repressor LexA